MNIVIDTNIFISALIKEGFIRKILVNSKHNFLFPEYEFIEIKNNKDEIIRKSGLSEIELINLMGQLLKYVKIVRNSRIIQYRTKAREIMSNIDEDDAIFVAVALAFNCPIWSEDKHFQKQKEIKIFTTKEIIEIYKNI